MILSNKNLQINKLFAKQKNSFEIILILSLIFCICISYCIYSCKQKTIEQMPNLGSTYCNSRALHFKIKVISKNNNSAAGTISKIRFLRLSPDGQASNMTNDYTINFSVNKNQDKTSDWYTVPIKSNCEFRAVNMLYVWASDKIESSYIQFWIRSGDEIITKSYDNKTLYTGESNYYWFTFSDLILRHKSQSYVLNSTYCNARELYIKLQLVVKNTNSAGGTLTKIKCYHVNSNTTENMTDDYNINLTVNKQDNVTTNWLLVPIKPNCNFKTINRITLWTSNKIEASWVKIWLKSGDQELFLQKSNKNLNSGDNNSTSFDFNTELFLVQK